MVNETPFSLTIIQSNMNTEEIQNELKIDLSNLDINSSENPLLIQKYLNKYYSYLVQLNDLESKLDELKSKKYQFYKTGYKLIPENITELNYLLNGDEEINTLKNKYKKLNIKISYIKDVIQQFKDRNWAIKNAIDFIKFKNGEN